MRGEEIVRFGGALRACAVSAALSAVLYCAVLEARAQTPPPIDLDAKKHELEGLQSNIAASESQKRKIEQEISEIHADRAKLNEALMDAAKQIQASDGRLAEVERRLDALTGNEEAIRKSLAGRRATIAEVLAVLQRMGRKPPPAVLANPEDMLEAIRASMLLGAFLPELRAQTEALVADLQDLTQLRAAIAHDRSAMAQERKTLADEKERLSALIEARKNAQGAAETALTAEKKRIDELASQAVSLKDLVARMENEIGAAQRAAEAARKAGERWASLGPDAGGAPEAAPFKDAARLTPAIPFASAKGRLPFPATGHILKTFGASDAFGGAEKGISIETRPNGLVVSPADGWVVFAGPYRSYKHLLILNAGDGYYLILAGMERIDVGVGQFVLAGEPVAVMGETAARQTSALVSGSGAPVLYVEFGKDGAPIDPGPWWAKSDVKKVRG